MRRIFQKDHLFKCVLNVLTLYVRMCVCLVAYTGISRSVRVFALQGMPSDQLRSHLVLMSQALNQAVQLISKEKIMVAILYHHTTSVHHTLWVAHHKEQARLVSIYHQREVAEHVQKEKEKMEYDEKKEKEKKEHKAEELRLKKEREDREKERRRQEEENLKKQMQMENWSILRKQQLA